MDVNRLQHWDPQATLLLVNRHVRDRPPRAVHIAYWTCPSASVGGLPNQACCSDALPNQTSFVHVGIQRGHNTMHCRHDRPVHRHRSGMVVHALLPCLPRDIRKTT